MTNWLFLALVLFNVFQLGVRRGRRIGHRDVVRELAALDRIVIPACARIPPEAAVTRVGDMVVGTIQVGEIKVRP